MQLLKIVGFSFVGLMSLLFISGFIYGLVKKPGTLLDYLNNPSNEKGYPAGRITEAKPIVDKLTKMRKEEVKNFIDSAALSLTEVSYSLYFWAMRHIQEGKVDEGVKLLKLTADNYLNPMAMTKLARLKYHGSEAFTKSTPNANATFEKDLKESFYYINLAFEITQIISEKSNDKTVLNYVVNDGLALFDTFHAMDVQNKFDSKGVKEQQKKKRREALEQYRTLYY